MQSFEPSPAGVNRDGEAIVTQSLDELIDRSDVVNAARISISPSLLVICRAMGSGLNLDDVLDQILDLTIQEMRAHQGSILLFNEHQDRLEMLASHGLPNEIVLKGYIPRKGGIAEWVIDHAEPLILNDRPSQSEFHALEDESRRIVSSMCVPLQARGDVLGTINLNRTDPDDVPFTDDDLNAMVIIASQAAIYIENSRLHRSNLESERLAAIGQTVAGISHCIKNLLTGLKGGISLVKIAREHEDWEIVRKSTEILTHSSDRISSLVLDMLDYSKERKPDLQKIELRNLIDEIIEVTREKTESMQIEITADLADDAPSVLADSNQLFRCLLDLVQNAIDACGQGGRVRIETERSTSEAAMRRLDESCDAAFIIRVADTGPGIPEKYRSQIFEPFFSTKGSRGTGLGLAVTRKIVAEHKGSLELTSPPEHSAVFSIYLPA